jgi:hypothetical protein
MSENMLVCFSASCLKIINYSNHHCNHNSHLSHLSIFVFMFKNDISVISWFLLLACIPEIYIKFCFYSTQGFVKSSWFYSWCKQWFCITVCCPSLLFPMHHFHYYVSQLLLIYSAYHQISLILRSACCAVGSKNISSYFYHYSPNFTCIDLEVFLSKTEICI